MLEMFSREVSNSLIFSREEVLRIKNKKITTANNGKIVIIERLLWIKNEYKIKNKTERYITDPLKTAMIEKECTKRPNKFIWDGPKYLFPLIEGIETRSELEIIFVKEPEKLLQTQASLASLAAASLGKQLKLPYLINLPVKI